MVRERSPVQARPLAKEKEKCLMIYHLSISLKTFEKPLLKKIEKMFTALKKKSEQKGYLFSFQFVSLPVTKKRITVLRSPHIDKKSREQFELRTHKKRLIIQTGQFDAFLMSWFFLQFPLKGTQIRLQAWSKTRLKEKT